MTFGRKALTIVIEINMYSNNYYASVCESHMFAYKERVL